MTRPSFHVSAPLEAPSEPRGTRLGGGGNTRRARRHHWGVPVVLVWIVCVLPPGAASGQDAAPTDAAAEGKRLYLANGCYACHGLDARGGGFGADLTHTTKSDEEMVARITNGRAGTAMRPFRDKIAAEDIRRIVVYLRSLVQR